VLLRRNALKTTLEAGHLVLSTSLNEARDPASIHAIAAGGADVVFIDLEHCPHNNETVIDLLAHSHASGLTPLVRPQRFDEASITLLVEGGCQSFLYPNVRRPSQVEELVDNTRRRPLGRRATLPVTAADGQEFPDRGMAEATEWANEQLLIGLVIETPEAVESLEKMLLPGVDMAVLGSYDLSYSYGTARDDPRVLEAEQRLQALCRETGVAYGAFPTRREQIPLFVEAGAQFINFGGVFAHVRNGVAETALVVEALRES
jgi:2-dehydro-3-deoxyglucarate aldolase/4-hydroxy-2-oxoheptanedioate aldolase